MMSAQAGKLHTSGCCWAVVVVMCLTAAAGTEGGEAGMALVRAPGAADRAGAVVAIPDAAHPIARYAAEELIAHVELATGVRLALLSESEAVSREAPRIWVGMTQAAAGAGMMLQSLPSEGCILRTVGGDLYIAGEDGPGDPLSPYTTHAGTLWGVYEFLERELGVRWIWPGELGTHVVSRDRLEIGAIDAIVTPRFRMRLLRPGLGLIGFAQGDARLGFSEAQRARYAQDQNVFLRRHRMGMSRGEFYTEPGFGGGHAFGDWWERFGTEHPEWFQLSADGRRGPTDPKRPDRYTMCVSNPGLHRKIVELWQEERNRRPGERVNIGIGENDFSAACLCAECRAWDGPDPDVASLPPGLERSYEPVQASNRYARFAQSVHALASAVAPDVKVQFYGYMNYFWAPDPAIVLHPNIIVHFVPWFRWAGWFPRTDAEQQWIKQQWLGWQRSGATIVYRPNWFLDGYAMPLVYMRQFADAFQFYAAHGMAGTDFDTLQGMWGAQGPNLYLLARIHTRPDQPLDATLQEFYDAFGPAADAIRGYFDYWEAYAVGNRERAADAIRSRRGGHFRRYALYAQAADELYPPEVFAPAWEWLDKAQAAVDAAGPDLDSVFSRRVGFVREGLAHALACVEAAQVMNRRDSTEAERAAALRRLAEYRRSVEHVGFANLDRAAIIETDSWQEEPGLPGAW